MLRGYFANSFMVKTIWVTGIDWEAKLLPKVDGTRTMAELISLAASLVAKCDGCIDGHMKKALSLGATKEEISETIAITMGVAAASVVDQTDIAAERLQIKHFE